MTAIDQLLAAGHAVAAVGDGPARPAALRVVEAFVAGARAARERAGPDLLAALDRLHPAAYEGAGLVASEHDADHPDTADHLSALLAARPAHGLLICIGHGWSRSVRDLPPALAPLSAAPHHRWWSVDGHGFQRGLLRPRHVLTAAARLPHDPAERALHDRGVGRSLWYRHAGDVPAIAHVIGRLGARADDLWCGVGIAAIFSGGLPLIGPGMRAELLRRGGKPLRDGAAIGGMSSVLQGPDFDLTPLRWLHVDLAAVTAAHVPIPDYLRWRSWLAVAVG